MSLSIGEVARRTGLSPDALRYYEREGLLPPPTRDAGGRRRYDDRILAQLHVVTTLRAGGFGVGQIRGVLGAKVPGTSARQRVDAVRAELTALRGDLARRREELDAASALLDDLAAQLDAGEPYADDPLDC